MATKSLKVVQSNVPDGSNLTTHFEVQLSEYGEVNEAVDIMVTGVAFSNGKLRLTVLADERPMKFFSLGRAREVSVQLLSCTGNIISNVRYTIEANSYKPRLVKQSVVDALKAKAAYLTFELYVKKVEYSLGS